MEEIDAIFPVSQPFYYDIFALRSKGWVDYNAVFFAHRLKKFFKIGSFIWNYLYIFRYQKSINKINNKPIKVTSAFGGIGIYDLSKIDINTSRYMVDSENTDWFSEHLYFNSYFNNLEIRTDWVIDAPNQHIEFKSFSIIHKFLYILRTLKFDFHSILQKEDEDPK